MADHRSLAATEHTYLEPRLCPLLDRQDLDPVEPGRLFVRRFAPVPALSEGARRESRTAGRDPLAAHPRVYRSTHDRRRNGDPWEIDLPLLPGTSRPDRDRTGNPRPRRTCWRSGRAEHQHVDGGCRAARPRLIAAT